jgi:glucose-1-phosphate adenylyltransferase
MCSSKCSTTWRAGNSLRAQQGQIYGFDFTGYWEDIGTIRRRSMDNLALADRSTLYTLRSCTSHLQSRALLTRSIIDNSVIERAPGRKLRKTLRNPPLGDRLAQHEYSGAVILDTIVMGSTIGASGTTAGSNGVPLIGIRRDCFIQARLSIKIALGSNVVMKPFRAGPTWDREWTVQDGIIIVPKCHHPPGC